MCDAWLRRTVKAPLKSLAAAALLVLLELLVFVAPAVARPRELTILRR